MGTSFASKNFIRTSASYNPKEGIGAVCYSIGDLKHVEACKCIVIDLVRHKHKLFAVIKM